jgi:hypothetical protein
MLDTEELSLLRVGELIVSNDCVFGVGICWRDGCVVGDLCSGSCWCAGVDAKEQLPCPILSHLTHDDMPSSTVHFLLCWLH